MAKITIDIAEAARRMFRPAGIPVLLYHGIAGPGTESIPTGERKFWITDAQFTDQLRRIQSGGYRAGSVRDFWQLRGPAAQALPLVAMTFDDGHSTDYTVAFPLLCEFGIHADFFINTATVGSQGFLTWGQIAEMHRAGMSFQSHSHNHVDLSLLPADRLQEQLAHSKSVIEERLGTSVEFLSVPYGLVNKRVISAAHEQGYRSVCTSQNWPATLGTIQIGRVSIHSDTDAGEFAGLLARDLSLYAARSAREAFLYLPKQVLLRLKPGLLTVQTSGSQP